MERNKNGKDNLSNTLPKGWIWENRIENYKKYSAKKYKIQITFQLNFPFILHLRVNTQNFLTIILLTYIRDIYRILISTIFYLNVFLFAILRFFYYLSIFTIIFIGLYAVFLPSFILFYLLIFEFHMNVSLSLCLGYLFYFQ